ncbi:MAG TPA: T9SS type A sorting domain-containing protein [Saprospiraceae bacterium]|nr:T9SS type A sorting domain-containing protein [Saprospiraceae bacterium]
MRRIALLTFLLCNITYASLAQCDDYIVKGSQVFHANDIRTVINTGGDMFWDLEEGKFQVPYESPNSPSAIFTAGVWIGGFDDVGNLKIAAQTYRSDNDQEYLPGPLTYVGVPFDPHCEHWDTIWSVRRHEIVDHILDYEADGVVDNPIKSVFGWPGKENVHFEQINGFSLPNLAQGYAPFFDKDQNDRYEPHHGEYPLPQHLDQTSIPDQITWNIFNDAGFHNASGGAPLRVEVHQTCYALYCTDQSLLNTTLFMDFRIVNRSTSILDSIYFAIWMDPDLGCYTDDYVGCVPDRNSFMVYNSDNEDGVGLDACFQGVTSYAQGPPVLSGSFLERDMYSFMYYYVAGPNFPSAVSAPTSPFEYYRLLSGSWTNGASLCTGGIGYLAGPGCERTRFAFPGDPNDSTSWAMINEDIPAPDHRIVASTYLERFDPGQSKNVSMSFSLHLDTLLDHLGNVQLMYNQLPEIQTMWNDGLPQCARLTIPCIDDCVWPGDIDGDGIANHYDMLYLSLANSLNGPQRTGPLSWSPLPAADWTEYLSSGVNVKHADLDGNGIVEFSDDVSILEDHYGLTHGEYQSTPPCTPGDDLIIWSFTQLDATTYTTYVSIKLNADAINSLNGIAFVVMYDPAFFSNAFTTLLESPFNASNSHTFHKVLPGRIDYVTTRYDHLNTSISHDKLLISFLLQVNQMEFQMDGNDTTTLCIADIIGILADGTEIPMGASKAEFIFLDGNATAVSDIKSQHISVYPNPSSGEIQIVLQEPHGSSSFSVFTMQGEQVADGLLNRPTTNVTLPPGLYALAIFSESEIVLEKIVILNQ